MHKGWRWAGAALGLALGAAAAGLPVFNGWQAERNWQAQVAQADRALSAGAATGANARIVEYRRGLYRSTVSTELVVPAALLTPGGRESLGLTASASLRWVLDQTVRHGWRGVRFDGDLRAVGALAPVMARLGGDAARIGVRGRLGFDSQSLVIDAGPLAGRTGGVDQLRLEANSALDRAGRLQGDLRLTGEGLDLPGLPRANGQAVLHVERLDTAALNQGAAAPWRSTLAALAAGAPRFALTRLRLETADGDAMHATANLRVQPLLAERLREGATGMALWEALRLDTELVIDQAMVEALPNEAQAWLHQGRASGFLRRREGTWRLALALEEGQLRLDDSPPR